MVKIKQFLFGVQIKIKCTKQDKVIHKLQIMLIDYIFERKIEISPQKENPAPSNKTTNTQI